jgi:chemotaxis protein CheZ
MSSQPPRRPYTAEIIMARQKGVDLHAAAANTGTGAGNATGLDDGSADRILAAISDLRKDLLENGVATESVAPAATAEADASAVENEQLQQQLTDLSDAIADTKRELASLRDPNVNSAVEVKSATRELDTVVSATESATNEIMSAAEQIDDLASRLRSQASSPSDAAVAEEINERVVNIFEACNFQDITGQRITKVVNTLTFIDERVSKMMEMWGAEFGEAGPDDIGSDEDLLNGPAPEGTGSSQDDIDALFD